MPQWSLRFCLLDLGKMLHGCASFILAQKLEALKADLRTWNEMEFGNVKKKKKGSS